MRSLLNPGTAGFERVASGFDRWEFEAPARVARRLPFDLGGAFERQVDAWQDRAGRVVDRPAKGQWPALRAAQGGYGKRNGREQQLRHRDGTARRRDPVETRIQHGGDSPFER